MKDYDVEREKLSGLSRQFTIGRETFTAMPAMPGWALSNLADVQKNPDREGAWNTLVLAVRGTLVPDDRERWDALVAADLNPPITFRMMMQLAADLVEEVTGRPPVQPPSSGSTDGRTQTPSTGAFVTVAPPGSPSSQPEQS